MRLICSLITNNFLFFFQLIYILSAHVIPLALFSLEGFGLFGGSMRENETRELSFVVQETKRHVGG